MAEELIKSVEDMLKEETWTRAAISNYSKEKFIELAGIVEKAKNEHCTRELQELCTGQLASQKDSIIALYLSGMLSLHEESLDNTSLVTLVEIFQNNHKEAVVEYLCTSIIEQDPNNKFALRTLAEFYRSQNSDKVWDLYIQIVKLDFEEADIARALADHYEETGDIESAKEYYKKAILRYVNIGNMPMTKELWSKLVQLIPEEIDFFQLVKRKVSKTLGSDKTAILLQELYNWYKDNKKWEIAIDLLKEILTIDQTDTWARKEITDCYRGLYQGHSHLEEYIKDSSLTTYFRNVFEAINDFEKHIAFDVKSYVFHRSWGVGIIRKVENDNLTIFFGKNGNKEMSLKMAINALIPLSKDHFWVIKASNKREKLNQMVKDDKTWALKTIIKSFNNSCDFKKIKAELVPSVLSVNEWTAWNTAAKKILETDANFGVNPNDITMYTVRDHEISKEEKLANEFKAQKQFFARIDTLMRYVDSDETDKTSEMFAEMFNYFAAYVKTLDNQDFSVKINEQLLASYLVVQNITGKIKQLSNPTKCTFAEIYEKISDPREMYNLLKDTKNTSLKRDFLTSIKMLPNWTEEYIRLFPTVLSADMIKILINANQIDKVYSLINACFESPKDYRNAVIYFFTEGQKEMKGETEETWFLDAKVPYEKQLITLIQLIELTFREINNHVNTTENKKINKNATALLFKDDTLIKYMFENDEETVKRMYTLIDDLQDIDPSYKAQMRNKILEKYSNFKFQTSTQEKTNAPKGMIVTAQKMEEKKKQLEQIQTVEIPANAKEIEEAREKGDLKENQEYKAAKEHQHKLNQDLKRIQAELNRAIVFDPTTITTAIISFATTVTLLNVDSGKTEEYTILGPWESDPDNHIISYMAPFGNALMDYKVGDSVKFKINEYSYNYEVKDIRPAKI
ncbi:MAG: transcription elongation factor GreA [Treponema sp.]|nr:transcription elongation factor GreA [Treponema sp.]